MLLTLVARLLTVATNLSQRSKAGVKEGKVSKDCLFQTRIDNRSKEQGGRRPNSPFDDGKSRKRSRRPADVVWGPKKRRRSRSVREGVSSSTDNDVASRED